MPQNGSPMNMTQRSQQAMSQPGAGAATGTRPTLPQQTPEGAQRIVNAQNAVKNPSSRSMPGQGTQAAMGGQRPSPGEVAQRLGMSVEDLARNPRLYWSAIGFSPPQQGSAPMAQPPMQPRRSY